MKLSVRSHGNYVGPGWSAGKWQDSVAYSDVPALDQFDSTARQHDKAYRLHAPKSDALSNIREDPKYLDIADELFVSQNILKGGKRTRDALFVLAQQKSRTDTWSGKGVIVHRGGGELPPTPKKQKYSEETRVALAQNVSSQNMPARRRNSNASRVARRRTTRTTRTRATTRRRRTVTTRGGTRRITRRDA
jgi:hypothetical protein